MALREFSLDTFGRKARSLRDLITKIESKAVVVGIFGAGYVGLPLACAFAEAGFRTIASDLDPDKILSIRRGECYVEDEYARSVLPRLAASGIIGAESDVAHVASVVDFAIITVPTPLTDKREPDLSYVTGVTETIAEKLRKGEFVILESSVYPGTTDEIVKPILERNGLRAGEDFGLAFSPERISFGSKGHGLKGVAKVVGGVTPLCTQIAVGLYSKVLQAKVVPVSDARTAEATKMLENVYRYVNIALVNELAVLHEKLGIDFFEVIRAASTKPYGFQPFYPGPGVGGHCIPKDPFYLVYKARQLGQPMRLIHTAREINERMIDHILERLTTRLRTRGMTLRGSKVAILGLAFKEDVSDTRNTPSALLFECLRERGAEVTAYDPFVHEISTKKGTLASATNLKIAVENAEILALLAPHTVFREMNLKELRSYVSRNAIIVDTRGFWSPHECKSAGFDYLGLGRPDYD